MATKTDAPRRISRRALLAGGGAILAGAASGPAVGKPQLAGSETAPIDVIAKPITDFSRLSGKARFGPLTFRGGLVLSSAHDGFGGWSGVVLDAGGQRLLAVSDAGSWLMADVTYQGDRPTGLASARIGPILTTDGVAVSRNRDRDAEAVTLLDGTLERGTLLVCFERNTRIGRFPVSDRGIGRPLGYLTMPPDIRRFDRNRSFEALTVLRGGRLRGTVLAFAERHLDAQGRHSGWLWISGKPEKVTMAAKEGFDVTDIAALPDGGILVLERSFGWFSGVGMRLRRISAAEISPGATLEGDVLVEADMSYDIDNMEGLAVHTGARGEIVVTLVSDDNFNHLLQRNILLQFTLDNEKSARA